ncbi:MAG: hypothetical protein HYW34_01845 [Candidatus Brennerbacteria bacterium]|nr:hypothetical protein [Candidatus Brennerbacteria bacterium]
MFKEIKNIGIFKAYDIRGRYSEEINEKTVGFIAAGIVKIFQHGKVLIARDARLSSPRLYKAVLKSLETSAEGGSASGGKNYKLKTIPGGVMTTPMFYFLVNHFKAAGGIMITASHNPKEYNGLKIVGRNAVPISGVQILKLLKR